MGVQTAWDDMGELPWVLGDVLSLFTPSIAFIPSPTIGNRESSMNARELKEPREGFIVTREQSERGPVSIVSIPDRGGVGW